MMDWFKSRKGQGLSLTVIIVAALALIVLVVLVLIFTGRMAVFTEGVGDEGQALLTKYKVTYGDCHPSLSSESGFLLDLQSAANDEDNEESLKIQAAEDFEYVISDCKSASEDKSSCTSISGCSWK